ncbi:MAG TPA: SprT family zinc-dependent metalloprotease [Gallionella sp.]|nr:SprT family zinc-dependent metalloprotease [Gallionella sp.]
MLKRLRNLMAPPAIPAGGVSGVSRLLCNHPPAAPARGMSGVSRLLCNHPPAIEQRAALLAGKHISYTLKRSGKRRSIGLRIDDRGLTVSMPLRASESWLHSVLQDKASWVVEKLDGWQSRKREALRWVDGESIPFLGEQLTLRIRPSLFGGIPQQRGKELWLFVADESDAAHIEQLVTHWYRRQAEPLFAERVAHYAPQLGVAPRMLKLSAARTQWGSCTARGTVRINEQLIRLPLRLIDYVVVHELAHLREMNHSAAFWSVVGSACPNYAKLRRELKAISLG